ncbi:phosphate signaling complex protein PhoU [Aliidiomarina maris]|uniref:Phosphate-specific transport system accessory protein PhoU n=1 Tax=Aliidiomarina maris TaxID=531312 RepID=A0A327WSL7_9GAMM|nr:phosphate signaling complex protein PhoU [Aliidiomarina maris]MBA3988513.1 phosphate transport system regulatory protein PhoU [Idiomarina sp.]MCL4409941.1 phosphate signaling complex protein PhoU [Gammaproteobacteria bacterium]MCL5049783.1 phosphate signaling complex protein PhoU [Bacillota bacterium]RAJ95360.1 PhoU-like phosphate uptake regulator [Aliidiomarina maris]RUO22749.1 phosphate transport system regulatory protein PhoU [Aliidiomarina maris]
MDNSKMGKHISSQFDVELKGVRNSVLSMGGEVEKQLADAIRAIKESDHELADKVLSNDRKINAFELDIDNACTQLIAKRQPTASDLRQVIATFKTIADLERIGDETKRIAGVAKETFSSEQQHLLASLENLGQLVLNMLRMVLNAFARMDAEEALEVHQSDQGIDRQYEAMLRQLMTYMMEDPRSIPKIMDVVFSARSLERIGDRCQNIAEYVIYNVHGKDVRHTSVETMQDTVRKPRA